MDKEPSREAHARFIEQMRAGQLCQMAKASAGIPVSRATMMNFNDQNRECHPERSEGSGSMGTEMLSEAKHDNILPISVVKVHYRLLPRVQKIRCGALGRQLKGTKYSERKRGMQRIIGRLLISLATLATAGIPISLRVAQRDERTFLSLRREKWDGKVLYSG